MFADVPHGPDPELRKELRALIKEDVEAKEKKTSAGAAKAPTSLAAAVGEQSVFAGECFAARFLLCGAIGSLPSCAPRFLFAEYMDFRLFVLYASRSGLDLDALVKDETSLSNVVHRLKGVFFMVLPWCCPFKLMHLNSHLLLRPLPARLLWVLFACIHPLTCLVVACLLLCSARLALAGARCELNGARCSRPWL